VTFSVHQAWAVSECADDEFVGATEKTEANKKE